jgi:hypothetical protein
MRPEGLGQLKICSDLNSLFILMLSSKFSVQLQSQYGQETTEHQNKTTKKIKKGIS